MSQPDDLSAKIWQGYNEQGEPTVPISRDEAAQGALHGASHLWLWRKVGNELEILLQRRADNKRTWAGYYDISAAGHIDAGETPIVAQVRELREELGIQLQPEALKLLFVYRQHAVDETSGIAENEFQFVYGYQVSHAVEASADNDEVSEIKWVDLDTFNKLIGEQLEDKIVPQGHPYFHMLLAELKYQADEDHQSHPAG
jgi:isopentenyldiphosphate isomerase